MTGFAQFFVLRPAFAIVISMVILLAGGLSLMSLPVAQYPQIAPPTVQVEATYQGANAQVVEQSVAVPIEQEVNGAANMIYMSSNCSSDGRYVLTCTFKVGTNLDIAAVDVQNRVSKAQAKLPSEVINTGISVKKQSPDLLMVLSVLSPDNSYDEVFLSNYAKLNITDSLARVPGVGNVMIVGEREYSMRIWLRPDKLAKLGLTAPDIAQAVREQNVQAPAGALGQPPFAGKVDFQYTVNVKGRLSSKEEYDGIVLRAQKEGSIIRIRDVARTELGAKSYTSYGRINGIPATVLLIYQLPGANALEVSKGVQAKLKDLSQYFPKGVSAEVSLDNTRFVTASIHEVLETLAEAFLLVLVVVFLFLGSFRTTLIPMLAVPVSLIGTFAIFVPLGFSVNLLTLFGLVLAIGIVVDDAIVVVEAVEAKLELGLSPTEATKEAMNEVSGPVAAIALVLCAVFVPVAFMSGITGQLYKQFALTLAVSTLLSALVALTLTPALCKMLLRAKHEKGRGPIAALIGAFNFAFAKLTDYYLVVVKGLIQFYPVVIAGLFAIVVGAYFLLKALPTAFVPEEDQGYFVSMFSLPDGASLQRTDALSKKAETFLKGLEGVSSVCTVGGFNLLTGSYGPNYVTFFTVLKSWEERKGEDNSAQALMQKAIKEFSKYPEAIAVSFNPPSIPGLGNSGGFQFELEDRKGGQPVADLANAADQLVSAGEKSAGLSSLYNSFRAEVPQLSVNLDRDKAKSLGIAINTIFESLQTFLGGLEVNDFNLFGRTYKVMLQAEPEFRLNPENIAGIYVRSMAGNMIPLGTLTNVVATEGPDLIQRYNLYRCAVISGNAAPGFSSGQAMQIMEDLAKKTLPKGFGFEWTGTAYQEKESAGAQGLIFVLSLVFVFLFLTAQYESWSIPISVLLAVPIGIAGAFLGLFARGLDNDVYAQIGLIMLIGLSAKNAILVVEFAKLRKEAGSPIREAALEAAKLRFRPILMTSFAFILGVLPMVIAEGAGAASRHSLGTAVFCGMGAATFLGVFFVPVFYVIVEESKQRISGFFASKSPAHQHGASTETGSHGG